MKNTVVWSEYNHGVQMKVECLERDEDEPFTPTFILTLGKIFVLLGLPKWAPIKQNHSYGFHVSDSYLHINYGLQSGTTALDKSKAWELPWSWTIVRWDLLYPDGSMFLHNSKEVLHRRWGDGGVKSVHWYEVFDLRSFKPLGLAHGVRAPVGEVYPFKWVLKDGTVQETEVMLLGQELEWRPLWTTWVPAFRKIHRQVEFNFKHEVGERAGSWKGGLMATTCNWAEGETMKAAFDRWVSTWDGK